VTAEVITLSTETTLDIPPERVLSAALGASLDTVLVIGRDAAGELYVASSEADAGALLVLLALAKRTVLDGVT
jgi:hypothetical protein